MRWELRVSFHTSAFVSPAFPIPSVGEIVLSPERDFSSFVKRLLVLAVRINFWSFYSVPLLFSSIFMRVPSCSGYSCLTMCLVLRYLQLCFIAQDYFSYFVFPNQCYQEGGRHFHPLSHPANAYTKHSGPMQSAETPSQSPKRLSHHLSPLGVQLRRKLDSEGEACLEPVLSDLRFRDPTWCLNHCAQYPPLIAFFSSRNGSGVVGEERRNYKANL